MMDQGQTPKDGGSVFPFANHAACIASEGCRIMPGLTIRDYFAGQAPFGIDDFTYDTILGALRLTSDKYQENVLGNLARFRALVAYEYADAMLAERAKRGGA